MALSKDLISQFAKLTKTEDKTKKETTVYGTVVTYNGSKYVRFDGSDLLTPVDTTVDVKDDERVTVLVKNHTATVTGNITSPAARTDSVKDVGDRVVQAETVLADTIRTDEFEATKAKIQTLEAENMKIHDKLETNEIVVKDLEADYIKVNNRIDALEIDAGIIDVEYLNANYAKITELNAAKAEIDSLEADVGDIDTLIFGSATGDTIQTSFSNSVIAQLGDAQIKSAMIQSVSASKITAGDIITNNVRVMSEDGSLIISDETMQISDDNRVRVQIGKDASGDYSINIWDVDGNLMFSKGGITDSAIKEAIIRNDMVSDTANIAAHKLDIDSLFEEINGSSNTIKSTQIYLDDEKQTLDVAFTSMTSDVNDLGETVSSQGTQISAIQGQITSKIWQQDIATAKNELEETTDDLSTKYSTLNQTVSGISSTVANHTSQINKKADNTTVTAINDKVTELEQSVDGFKTTVSNTYATKTALTSTDTKATNAASAASSAQKDVDALETRVATAETSIEENADAIALRATKTEVATAKSEAISTASNDATTKANNALSSANTNTANKLKSYSTTAQMNAAIDLKADSINSSVSSTYATKTSLNTTNSNVNSLTSRVTSAESNITQLSNKITSNVTETNNLGTRMSTVEQTASGLTARLDDMRIGGRNLLRNSRLIQMFSNNTNVYPISCVQTTENGATFYRVKRSDTTNYPNTSLSMYCTIPKTSFAYGEMTGKQVTLSFKARVSHEITISFMDFTYGGDPVVDFGKPSEKFTTEWKTYYVVIDEFPDMTNRTGIRFNPYNVVLPSNILDSFYIDICDYKFELGNQPTDWSPAPEDVDSDISDASKTATDYLSFSSSGLIVGDMTASTLGKNVLIDSDSVDIRNGTTTLASFGANKVTLGRNSEDSVIDLCDGAGRISANTAEASTSYPHRNAILIDSQEIETESVRFVAKTTNEYGATSTPSIVRGTELYMLRSGGSSESCARLKAEHKTTSSGAYTSSGISAMTYDSADTTRAMVYAMDSKNSKYNNLNVYPTKTTMNKNLVLNGTTFTGKNKVLWSGEYYMSDTQTATLSEAISAQANGVVLVWSYYNYTEGASDNSNFNMVYVPKHFMTLHLGKGVTSVLSNSSMNIMASKYTYISDTTIKGYAGNDDAATTKNTGVTATSKNFVLRYVIGV